MATGSGILRLWDRWHDRSDPVAAPKDVFSGTLAVSLFGRSS